jgi:hypothetical protein
LVERAREQEAADAIWVRIVELYGAPADAPVAA